MDCSQDWVNECFHYWDELLTGDCAHWCPDWDYLPIDETCQEFEHCTCKEFKNGHISSIAS